MHRLGWTFLFLVLVGSAMLAGSKVQAAELGQVDSKIFTIHDFRLANGTVMPEVKIAYEAYGTLAPNGRNAVLITHGYTSTHHAAGRNPANGNALGWWDGLIGPGKAIDTDRLFVVSSNALGSSAGSTNGASLNPATGKPYGADFPAISMRDIVAAQKALLDGLGVKHLVAVAGPSLGGYQAFQWSVSYPAMMDGVVAVVTAPRSRNVEKGLAELQARLATDPNWNGGNYYDKGGVAATMTEIRVETLKRYGIEASLAEKFPDPTAREAEIRRQATKWASSWDANSLVILRRATLGYDTVPEFPRIKAKLLYVLCRTDRIFPPTIGPEAMNALKAAGVDARYFQIDSEFGHSASGRDWAKWAPALHEFLAPLVAAAG
ncbi:MAG TPA: alpha/beta fold hydrolase [Stellaceae bacterium]|jgi:homoserine O-acetyltransferase|nr:alpha/beta fold hydrolase [Stellaceae bacterium]